MDSQGGQCAGSCLGPAVPTPGEAAKPQDRRGHRFRREGLACVRFRKDSDARVLNWLTRPRGGELAWPGSRASPRYSSSPTFLMGEHLRANGSAFTEL